MATQKRLPARAGPRPRTTATNPHQQLDQQPSDPFWVDSVRRRALALPGVVERPSLISVPGARALWLEEELAGGPPQAFLVGLEFAHFHPAPDLSLHLMLPEPVLSTAVELGWAEPHPVARLGLIPANAVMVYAPRDTAEMEVVAELVEASYSFARGQSGGSPRG